ncbi:MAG: hypothetical protein H6909_04880 [Rickettsiaceae bacterium]|nr:hypothetical protein [Rickettsiaceae bacterium]
MANDLETALNMIEMGKDHLTKELQSDNKAIDSFIKSVKTDYKNFKDPDAQNLVPLKQNLENLYQKIGEGLADLANELNLNPEQKNKATEIIAKITNLAVESSDLTPLHLDSAKQIIVKHANQNYDSAKQITAEHKDYNTVINDLPAEPNSKEQQTKEQYIEAIDKVISSKSEDKLNKIAKLNAKLQKDLKLDDQQINELNTAFGDHIDKNISSFANSLEKHPLPKSNLSLAEKITRYLNDKTAEFSAKQSNWQLIDKAKDAKQRITTTVRNPQKASLKWQKPETQTPTITKKSEKQKKNIIGSSRNNTDISKKAKKTNIRTLANNATKVVRNEAENIIEAAQNTLVDNYNNARETSIKKVQNLGDKVVNASHDLKDRKDQFIKNLNNAPKVAKNQAENIIEAAQGKLVDNYNNAIETGIRKAKNLGDKVVKASHGLKDRKDQITEQVKNAKTTLQNNTEEIQTQLSLRKITYGSDIKDIKKSAHALLKQSGRQLKRGNIISLDPNEKEKMINTTKRVAHDAQKDIKQIGGKLNAFTKATAEQIGTAALSTINNTKPLVTKALNKFIGKKNDPETRRGR